MSEDRVVIRDNDYYGGSVFVENLPTHTYEICELTIIWEAYQGGGAQIVLQEARELEDLGRLLLKAAETLRPDATPQAETAA